MSDPRSADQPVYHPSSSSSVRSSVTVSLGEGRSVTVPVFRCQPNAEIAALIKTTILAAFPDTDRAALRNALFEALDLLDDLLRGRVSPTSEAVKYRARVEELRKLL